MDLEKNMCLDSYWQVSYTKSTFMCQDILGERKMRKIQFEN